MKTIQKHVVLTPEYHAKIAKLAEQERRPMGRQLEILIDIALPILNKPEKGLAGHSTKGSA